MRSPVCFRPLSLILFSLTLLALSSNASADGRWPSRHGYLGGAFLQQNYFYSGYGLSQGRSPSRYGWTSRDYRGWNRHQRGVGWNYGRDIWRGGYSGFVSQYHPPYRWPYGQWRGGRWPRHRGGSITYFGGDAGLLVGGLVLGTALGTTLATEHHAPRREVRSSGFRRVITQPAHERVVVRRSSARPGARRLLRDLNGECFEIEYSSAGDEIRTQLDPSACNF